MVSFASFICKPLTRSHMLLEVDDTVLCADTGHSILQGLSAIVIVLFAFGLPLATTAILVRKTVAYSRQSDINVEKIQQLSVELGVPLATAEFVIREVEIGKDMSCESLPKFLLHFCV